MTEFPEFDSPRIFPAIDIRGGRCVRLIRGARDAELRYDADPVEVAQRWEEAGSECLHVIDLGAAFGEENASGVVLEIAATVGIPVQTGGGIRDEGRVERLLQGGIGRVILGTRALRDGDFLRRMVERYGRSRIVVALDCEGESVKVAGWEEDSSLSIDAVIEKSEESGTGHFLVTATDRDGTFGGLRVDLVRRILESSESRVVAAGGVGTLEHVRAALDLAHPRLEGVVIGRALYEGTVDLREAIELSRMTSE